MPYADTSRFIKIGYNYRELLKDFKVFKSKDWNDDFELFDESDRMWKTANSLIEKIKNLLQDVEFETKQTENKYNKMLTDLSDISYNAKNSFIDMYNYNKGGYEHERSWLQQYGIYKEFIK